eukprot:1223736-Rhodomonas_salina.1
MKYTYTPTAYGLCKGDGFWSLISQFTSTLHILRHTTSTVYTCCAGHDNNRNLTYTAFPVHHCHVDFKFGPRSTLKAKDLGRASKGRVPPGTLRFVSLRYLRRGIPTVREGACSG